MKAAYWLLFFAVMFLIMTHAPSGEAANELLRECSSAALEHKEEPFDAYIRGCMGNDFKWEKENCHGKKDVSNLSCYKPLSFLDIALSFI